MRNQSLPNNRGVYNDKARTSDSFSRFPTVPTHRARGLPQSVSVDQSGKTLFVCLYLPQNHTPERGWKVIEISITGDGLYQVMYRLEGVRCTTFETNSLDLTLTEVKQKLQLAMGLAKGKILTATQERVQS